MTGRPFRAPRSPSPEIEGAERTSGLARRWGWAVAAALVLLTGVAIGRWSVPSTGTATGAGVAAVTPAGPDAGRSGGASPALHLAATEHLKRTEAFLVGVRADAERGSVDPGVSAWAESLLTETRLLLDSEAGRRGPTGRLLRDLEWILVQVAALPEGEERRERELELLRDGIDDQDVLFRIRAAGPGASAL